MICWQCFHRRYPLCFIWGVLSKKGTPKAGYWTLIFGFTLAILAFCLDFELIAGQRIITDVMGIHFMMKAFYLFIMCSIFYFTVSAFTAKADKGALELLTLKKPLSFITEGKVSSLTDPRILAAILILMMAVLYYVFR